MTITGACLSIVLAQAPKPFAPPRASLVLYRDVILIDGLGGPERAGMDVLVNGERIEKVFPDAELEPGLLLKAKAVPLAGRLSDAGVD